MVNDAEGAELALALSYAPPARRVAIQALLSLDATLGRIVRTTREPLVGQMRLTWWAEALERLDSAAPPAEPVLTALAATVLPLGLSGAALAAVVEGWEAMLFEPLDEGALLAHARGRGGALFQLAARALDGDTPGFVADAGTGWALADLSRNLSDPGARQLAGRLAADLLRERWHWPRALRALGALTTLARDDVSAAPHRAGHPVRTARLLALRLIGR